MNERVDKLLRLMEESKLDAFLVTKGENIRYLSGFTGGEDARLLISARRCYIFTDSRYLEQAVRECPGWELVEIRPPGLEELRRAASGLSRIGVESHVLSYDAYCELERSWDRNVLVPWKDKVETLRQIKEESELELIRQACRIGDEVFAEVLARAVPGMEEREIAADISYGLRCRGCAREAFATIAVAGENAALPHGQPGERKLAPGDMLTLDFGGFYQGYAADMTRTVALAQASAELQARYEAVLEAQLLGISLVKAGAACRDIDQGVRDCLRSYELDSYFAHSTGHSLGLEIHELPSLSSRSDAVLEENMVVTIEPGVYIPGWGGIRIEDTVIVKKGGCEVITHSNKSLLII